MKFQRRAYLFEFAKEGISFPPDMAMECLEEIANLRKALEANKTYWDALRAYWEAGRGVVHPDGVITARAEELNKLCDLAHKATVEALED